MRILAFYNAEQLQSRQQLKELEVYCAPKYEVVGHPFYDAKLNWQTEDLYDFVFFIGDDTIEKDIDEQLAIIKEKKESYSPLIRIGPNDSKIMNASLAKGFDDYLPADMLFRLPFILNRWHGPGKALPNVIYKLIYEDASEAIAIYDLDSLKLTALNKKAYEVLEETGDPVKKGVKITAYLNEQELAEKPLRLDKLIQGETINDQRDLITAKGTKKRFSFTVKMIPGRRIIIILRDVSLHFETQENINQRKKITRLSEKMVGLGSSMYHISSGKTVWSENMFELLGYSYTDTIPSPERYIERIHLDDRALVWDLYNKIIEGNGPDQVNGKHRIITPEGKKKVIAVSLLVEYKDNKPHIIYTANQDITQREEELNQLRESRLVLEQASKISGLGIARWNTNTNEVHWSKGIYEILGLAPDSLKPALEFANHFLSESGRKLFWKEVERFKNNPGLEEEYIAPIYLFKKNRILKVWAKSLKEDNQVIVYNVVQDITENYQNQQHIKELNKRLKEALIKERKKAILQLRESEEKYRILSENSLDLITAHAPDGTYTFVSGACKSMLGYEKEDLLGKNPYDFFHPEDTQDIMQRAHSPLLDKSSNQVSITYRYRKKNGQYIWLQSRSKTILDDNHQVKAIHTYSRDISKLVEADLKLKETLKKEREINELRSQFVTTASHQFRTPLASIKASAQYLGMMIHQPEHQEIFQTIDHETNRLTMLMNDILTLGKVDAQQLSPIKEYIDLPSILQKAITQNLHSEGDSREIQVSIKGKPRVLLLDANLIEHALSNLLSNALKYSRCKAAPVVSIHYKSTEVQINVKDFGRGIPEEDQANLFTSFFRAKNVQDIEGTGLGLVIARQFINLNGGFLRFKSKVEKGTTFIVSFPYS